MITRVKIEIDRAGLKQAHIAFALNIPERRLSDYVTGRRRPAYSDASKIAKLLRIPVGTLFTEYK